MGGTTACLPALPVLTTPWDLGAEHCKILYAMNRRRGMPAGYMIHIITRPLGGNGRNNHFSFLPSPPISHLSFSPALLWLEEKRCLFFHWEQEAAILGWEYTGMPGGRRDLGAMGAPASWEGSCLPGRGLHWGRYCLPACLPLQGGGAGGPGCLPASADTTASATVGRGLGGLSCLPLPIPPPIEPYLQVLPYHCLPGLHQY